MEEAGRETEEVAMRAPAVKVPIEDVAETVPERNWMRVVVELASWPPQVVGVQAKGLPDELMTMVLSLVVVERVTLVPADNVLKRRSTPDLVSKRLRPVPRLEPVLASPPAVPHSAPMPETRPFSSTWRQLPLMPVRLVSVRPLDFRVPVK